MQTCSLLSMIAESCGFVKAPVWSLILMACHGVCLIINNRYGGSLITN